MNQVAGSLKADLSLEFYGSKGIQEKWFSASSCQPHNSPLTKPIPQLKSGGQMASPRGHVLFSFVIPPPPLLSAYCLSDKNLPVLLTSETCW